jgi:hypothetical protein
LKTRTIIRAGLPILLGIAFAFLMVSVVHAGTKVTICHAAGLAGTTHYNTLNISENAVYGRHGNAGHFEENGTPRAGHEQDYFGACESDSTPTPTPSASPSSSPTSSPSASPTPLPSENIDVPATASPPSDPELPNTAAPYEEKFNPWAKIAGMLIIGAFVRISYRLLFRR